MKIDKIKATPNITPYLVIPNKPLRFCIDDLTIFVRYRSALTPSKDSFMRFYILGGCLWEFKTIKSVAGTTANVSQIQNIYISYPSSQLEYNEWLLLSNDLKPFYIPLTSISNLTLIKGISKETITGVTPNMQGEVVQRNKPLSTSTLKSLTLRDNILIRNSHVQYTTV